MICERVKEQIPECLAGRLEKAEREKVIEHLETCAGCRNELAELGAVRRGMEALAIPAEPEPVMKSRFMEVMEAYQEGLLAAQEHARARQPRPPLQSADGPASGRSGRYGSSRWLRLCWWPASSRAVSPPHRAARIRKWRN